MLENSSPSGRDGHSRGSKHRILQFFVEILEEFPILIIQSKTSASTHEYSESSPSGMTQRGYVMLLSNFGDDWPRTQSILGDRMSPSTGICYLIRVGLVGHSNRNAKFVEQPTSIFETFGVLTVNKFSFRFLLFAKSHLYIIICFNSHRILSVLTSRSTISMATLGEDESCIAIVTIHRTEKYGGCTFYHNTLRT